MNKEYTKSEILEIVQKEQINENFGETALLAASFIPGIGTFANIALIIKYYKEQRYLESGLMLVAMIPFVGDLMVLPFLKIFKGLKGGMAINNSAKLMQVLSKNPEAKELFLKIGSKMKGPEVEKIIAKVSAKKPAWGQALRDIQQKQVSLASQVASKKIIPNVVSTGIKAPFKQRALGKYLIKTGGVPPATKLSQWWNVTYKANRMRRNLVTKLIMGSNLLGTLGIGSIKELEAKLSNNEDAAKLMQNPEFAKIYNQSMQGMSPEETQSLENPGFSGGNNEGGLKGLMAVGALGVGGLKLLAKFLVP